MNIERQAIKDIKYLASMTRGLSEFAEQLGEAATLETLVQTKQARIAELEQAERGIAGKIDACEAECAAKIRAAQSTASKTLAEADADRVQAARLKADAERLVAEARQEAEAIINKAKVDAREAVAAEIELIKRKL